MGEQRPIEQLAGYRAPIAGLYQVGAAMHPADAVIAGSGYNCWKIMKQDLGL
jgi:phytoene dehydrogenase-like protein